jgi:RNA polymerase sigma factor (sigma-70 family)
MADGDEGTGAESGALAQAQSGAVEQSERDFIAELFVMYHTSVRRFLSKRVTSEEAAELTQETYYRLLRQGPALRRGSTARALLFRTATNLARDHHRRKLSHRTDQHIQIDVLEIATDHPGPDEMLVREQALSAIESTIAQLPADTRTVLKLRLSQELSYLRIAETMNLSTRTVARKMADALERLAIVCDTV